MYLKRNIYVFPYLYNNVVKFEKLKSDYENIYWNISSLGGLPVAKINNRYGNFWRKKLSTEKIKGLISQSSRRGWSLVFYIANKTSPSSFSPPIVPWSAKISLTRANPVNCRIDLTHRRIFPWKVFPPAFTQWTQSILTLSPRQHVINFVAQSICDCLCARKALSFDMKVNCTE